MNVDFSYDKEAGILYLSLGVPEPATCHEEHGILMRTSMLTGKPCGATIMNYDKYDVSDKIVAIRSIAGFLDVNTNTLHDIFDRIA